VSSAKRVFVTSLAATALTVALSGCVSTQQKARWNQIANSRILASQNPTVVRHAASDVRVKGVSVVHNGNRFAIVVRLRNATTHPLNDLPISIGTIGRHGTRTYLNRGPNLDYFKNHVAVIPASATVTWVFTGRRRQRLSGRPFAIAGSQGSPPITVARVVPPVSAAIAARIPGKPALRVTVTNRSSIPQLSLQVYAVSPDGGRYSAAGSAAVASLAAGKSATVRLGLIGRGPDPNVQVQALPTLFQ
jgi:hypothetical protein